MGSLLARIGNGLKGLVGLVLPMFGKASGLHGLGTALRWILHVVLLVAILVGLHYANEYFRLHELMKTRIRFLAHNWLPILFLLIYVLWWLSWWLWKLLAPEDVATHFPDLDAAWAEAVASLTQAGIDLTGPPLFLVLGETQALHPALFQASQLKFQINPAPQNPNAPLHVYAYRDPDPRHDAIYVICPSASLLARQANLLGSDEDPAPRSPGVAPPQDLDAVNVDDSINKTLSPARAPTAARHIAILNEAAKKGRRPDQLTAEEQRELRLLERKDKPRRSLLHNAEEVERLTARLEHVCRLIMRDRWPFCPVNGLLVLVPFAATDTDQDAVTTGEIFRRELAVVRRGLKVFCPQFALVCDLETAPGFTEFISRFSEKERQQRMGQRSPLVPKLRRHGTVSLEGTTGDENLEEMIGSLARWLCNSFFPGWVYKKFRLETPGKDERVAVVQDNARLVLFLDQLRERQNRLANLLTQGLTENPDLPPLFGGCYFGGTGHDPAREQAFVAGVFRRLPEEQNWVAWTPEALAEEESYQRWVRRGWVFLVLVLVGALGLLGYHFFGPGPKGPSVF